MKSATGWQSLVSLRTLNLEMLEVKDLMEEKSEMENPNLNIVSVFPDAVHVAKRKRPEL